MLTQNTRGRKVEYNTITEDEWDNLSKPKEIDEDIDIEDMRDRFWSHVYRWGDKCWLWAGPMAVYRSTHHIQDEKGNWVIPEYNNRNIRRIDGRFNYKGKTYIAYRASYLLEIGDIPEGYDVHHTCKEPLCVRPEHLKAMSYSDHIKEHNGEGRDVPLIVRLAMEQFSREEKNPNLYTKDEKTRRWSYLRYYIRQWKSSLLFDGQPNNWTTVTGDIEEDRG